MLKEIELNRYGKYKDKKFKFKNGLNFIVGNNEEGKTTLINAIKDLLFGFNSPRLKNNKYSPWNGKSVEIGGKFIVDGSEINLKREISNSLKSYFKQGESITKLSNKVFPYYDYLSKETYSYIYAITQDEMNLLTSKSWNSIMESLIENYGVENFNTPSEAIAILQKEKNEILRDSKRGNYKIKEIDNKISKLRNELLNSEKLELELLSIKNNKKSIFKEISGIENELKLLTKKLKEKNELKIQIDKYREIKNENIQYSLNLDKLDTTIDLLENLIVINQSLNELNLSKKMYNLELIKNLSKIKALNEDELKYLEYENDILIFPSKYENIKLFEKIIEKGKEKIIKLKKNIKKTEIELFDTCLNQEIISKIKKLNLTKIKIDSDIKFKNKIKVTKNLAIDLILIVMSVVAYSIFKYIKTDNFFTLAYIFLAIGIFDFVKSIYLGKKYGENYSLEQIKNLPIEKKYFYPVNYMYLEKLEKYIVELDELEIEENELENKINEYKKFIFDFKENLFCVFSKDNYKVNLEFSNDFEHTLKELASKLFKIKKINELNKSINNSNKAVQKNIDDTVNKILKLDKKKELIENELKNLFLSAHNININFLINNLENIRKLNLKLNMYKEKYLSKIQENNGKFNNEFLNQNLETIDTEVIDLESTQAILLNKINELGKTNAQLTEREQSFETFRQMDIVSKDLELSKNLKSELLEERDLIYLSIKVLEMYDEKYKIINQPNIIKRAKEYFAFITSNKYSEIFMDTAENNVVFLATDYGEKSINNSFSKGTKEQLYFCLRLSIIENIEKNEKYKLPLVFDETFANWDDNRYKKALSLIENNFKNRVVLILSCHDRII
ncbi:AAA family ATPase [Helicovermis profundi]|uniref:YhaN AAA domain-containing protein n=1 Tax=Helicovermis profundi TaxID=3065157 RepID=A0AAU9EKP0_9FIRM|nr:hypothetical protein HLPR_08900 [Clostridia bacterium S502]